MAPERTALVKGPSDRGFIPLLEVAWPTISVAVRSLATRHCNQRLVDSRRFVLCQELSHVLDEARFTATGWTCKHRQSSSVKAALKTSTSSANGR